MDLTTPNPVRGSNAIDDVTYQWGCLQGNQAAITVDLISCGGPTMDANTYVPVLLGSTETHYDVVSHDPSCDSDHPILHEPKPCIQ